MNYKREIYVEQARTRHRTAVLGALLLVMGFGAAAMAGACGTSAPGTEASTSSGGSPNPATECPATVEVPCMRYHIPLVGNPSTDIALRSKYIAAFGTACYMSEFDTFDCFYQKWQDACADAVKIGEVSGNAPYDKGYMCQPVAGTETTRSRSARMSRTTSRSTTRPRRDKRRSSRSMACRRRSAARIETWSRETSARGMTSTATAAMADGDGGVLTQQKWILQVNRNANDWQDSLRSPRLHVGL
jgi:hypothetical protein